MRYKSLIRTVGLCRGLGAVNGFGSVVGEHFASCSLDVVGKKPGKKKEEFEGK